MKPDHSILSDLALTSAADKAVARSHGLIVRTRRQMMATHEIIEESRRALERSMAILSQGQVVRGK